MNLQWSDLELSVLIAFIAAGLTRAIGELNAPTLNRREWAHAPTIGKFLLITFTWFAQPFFDSRARNAKEAIACGLVAITNTMLAFTVLIFGSLTLSKLLLESIYLQIAAMIIFVAVGSFIVLPILVLLSIPLTLLLMPIANMLANILCFVGSLIFPKDR